MKFTVDKMVDAKGLACPMPIVRSRKAIKDLQPGQVMEVQATDRGSTADLKAWAEGTGHQYLGTVEEGKVLKHYVRKASVMEKESDITEDIIISLKDLKTKYNQEEKVHILDVREEVEFAFGHIPGAVNIPLGEIEQRMNEINPKNPIYVICRTGNRSDMAVQLLRNHGFEKAYNIVPGMTEWDGPTDS